MSLQTQKASASSVQTLLVCSVCQFTTHDAALFDIHQTSCPRSLSNSDTQQLKNATVSRNYQCDRCPYSTNKSRQYLLHRKIVHTENFQIYGCTKCVYASKSKNKLLRHRVLVHKDSVPITDIVPLEDPPDYSSSLLISDTDRKPSPLKQSKRQRSRTGNKTLAFEGPESGKRETPDGSVFDYISWQVTSSSGAVAVGSCILCGFSNAVKSKVYNHIKKTHFRVSVHSCQLCGLNCTSEADLAQHSATHNNSPKLQIQRVSPDMNSMPKLSPAPVNRGGTPGLRPARMPRLSANQPGIVGSSGELQCGICGLVVKTESRLKIHLISHSNASTWTCPLCPLRYKRPADLNRHMKRKHGVKLRDFRDKTSDSGQVSERQSPPVSEAGRASSIQDGNTDSEQDVPLDLCVKKNESYEEDDTPLDLSRKDGYSPGYFERLERQFVQAAPPAQSAPSINCPFCSQSYSTVDELNFHVRDFHRFSPSRLPLASASLGVVVPYPSSDSDVHNRSGDSGTSARSRDSTPLQDMELGQHPSETTGSRSLKCSYCDYVAKHKSEYERHLSSHTGEKPFRCMYCPFSTIWKQDIKRHLPKQHPDEVNAHGDLASLIERSYLPPKPNSKLPFASQIKEETNENSSIASLASLVDSSMDEMLEENNNVSSHKEQLESCYLGGSWEVKEADQASESSGSVSHQASNVAVNKLGVVCHICSCSCKTTSRLKKHMEIHENLKRFMCPYCGKRSNWHSDVRRHINRGHPGKKEKVLTLTKEEAKDTLDSYIRDFGESTRCLGSHTTKNGGEETAPAYADVSNNEEMVVTEPGTSNGDPTKRYKCSHCGKQSKWRWNLLKHIQGEHDWAQILDTHARAGSPVCSVCGQDCKSWGRLENHMQIHENLKKYMCPHCGKRSNWQAVIRNHIRTYHVGAEERIVTLSEEQAKASLDEYLEKCGGNRKRTRKGAKAKDKSLRFRRFQCSKCGKRSNWRWQLNQHVKKMHSNAHVIELDVEVARATFSDAFTGSHSRPSRKEVQALNVSQNLSPSSTSSAPVSLKQETSVPSKSFMARPYKCSKCGQKARLKCHLSWHTKPGKSCEGAEIICLREAAVDLAHGDALVRRGVAGKKYKCRLCPFSSTHATALVNHEKWKHTNHANKKNTAAAGSADKGYVAMETDVVEPNGMDEWQDADDNNWTDVDDSITQTPTKSRPSENASTSTGAKNASRNRKFMCSECGRRSNWRWNLKMHIKSSHPYASVIELSEEEAQATYIEPRKKMKSKTKGAVLSGEITGATAAHPVQSGDPSKPFGCDLCPFRSGYIKSLTNHKKWKHPEAWIKLLQSRLGMNPPAKDVTDSGQVKDGGDVAVTGNSMAPDIAHASAHWKCPKCDFISSKLQVIQHMRDRHPNSVQYTCSLCGYVSGFRGSACRHVTLKHGLAPPSCYVIPPKLARCSMKQPASAVADSIEKASTHATNSPVKPASYSSNSEALMTPDHHSVGARFRCSVCPFQTAHIKNLYHHKRYHKPKMGKKSVCKFCPFYVVAPRLIRQHARVHLVDPKPVAPAVCKANPIKPKSARFPGSGPLKGKTSSTLHCHVCPFVSNYPSRFAIHLNLHKPHPGGNHKCPHCPYWCKQPFNLTNHLNIHTEQYIRNFRPDLVHTLEKDDPNQIKLNRVEASPTKSDISEGSGDEVENAAIKQKIIASKIEKVSVTPSKLEGPRGKDGAGTGAVLPMPVLGEGGELLQLGQYRSLHKCPRCPYTNARLSCLVLHEKMHVQREMTGDKSIFKCPYCTYNVANKGLLVMHLKVHTKQYAQCPEDINDVEPESPQPESEGNDEISTSQQEEQALEANSEATMLEPLTVKFPEKPTYKPDYPTTYDLTQLPQKSEFFVKYDNTTGEHLLEKAVYKKWCCERCPYATTKKSQFEKHVLLHGSAQKYTCQFCDYSVPGYHLLLQHQRLHLAPNSNLLSVQSVANLQRLPIIPADIAAAAPSYGGPSQPMTANHDNIDLYENSDCFDDAKKLFRCDRCPYSNARRDQLLSHLKFHMIRSELKCSFCDYSVSKGHLLNQHMKIHFNTPGSEMNPIKKKRCGSAPQKRKATCLTEEDAKNEFVNALQLQKKDCYELDATAFELPPKVENVEEENKNVLEQEGVLSSPVSDKQDEVADPDVTPVRPRFSPDGALDLAVGKRLDVAPATFCKYCSRDLGTEEALQKHIARHLDGNSFALP